MDYLMTLVTKARVALRVWMTLLFSWESSQIDEGWNSWNFHLKKCCWVHTNNVFVLHGRCQKFSKPWLGTKDFSRFSKSIFFITIDVKKPRKVTLTKMRKSKFLWGCQPHYLQTTQSIRNFWVVKKNNVAFETISGSNGSLLGIFGTEHI